MGHGSFSLSNSIDIISVYPLQQGRFLTIVVLTHTSVGHHIFRRPFVIVSCIESPISIAITYEHLAMPKILPPPTIAVTVAVPGILVLFIIACILRGFHIHPQRGCLSLPRNLRRKEPPPVIPLNHANSCASSSVTIESTFIGQNENSFIAKSKPAYPEVRNPNVRYPVPAPYNQEDQDRRVSFP